MGFAGITPEIHISNIPNFTEQTIKKILADITIFDGWSYTENYGPSICSINNGRLWCAVYSISSDNNYEPCYVHSVTHNNITRDCLVLASVRSDEPLTEDEITRTKIIVQQLFSTYLGYEVTTYRA